MKKTIKSNNQVILAQAKSVCNIMTMFRRQILATTTTRSIFNNVLLLIVATVSCHHLVLISCQTNPNDLLLQPDARADINRLQARRQPAASLDLNQLVSLFNSIQHQQRQRNNELNPSSSNVQPLPLGTMGGQRGGGVAPPRQQLSSTPANPFVAAANFQPMRRPPQQQQQPGLFFSSPAPQLNSNPALTLNRINLNSPNNDLRPRQQPQPHPHTQQQFSSPLPQPINTMPLGQQARPPQLNQVVSRPSPQQGPSRTTQDLASVPTTTTATVSTSTPTSSPSTAAAATTDTTQKAESSDTPSTWNPVPISQIPNANRSSQQTTLAPSPDIVTVPPGYDPNQQPPQTYDISVSAQMGGNSAPKVSPVQLEQPSAVIETSSVSIATAAPTAVTTIIWSPPSTQVDSASLGPAQAARATRKPEIQPTRVVDQQQAAGTAQLVATQSPAAATTSTTSTSTTSTTTATSASTISQAPTRIRDNSAASGDDESASESTPGVVYGKSDGIGAKPTGPPPAHEQAGRPFIQSAPLDNQVRAYTAGARQQQTHAAAAPFKPSKQIGANGQAVPSSNVVGSAFTIVANGNQTMPSGDIQDYVAGQPPPIISSPASQQEPTISASGGPDPFELPAPDLIPNGPSGHGEVLPQSSSTQAPPQSSSPKIRRPTFKPKPAVPPIRIDSCIVGDDSSCDQSHNERCVTEYGISSCHCRPGYARLSQLRGYCSPVVSLQFSMRIDKLSDDRKLVFNHTLENPNSEEYQYLEFETLQAISSGMQQTSLQKQFMGARVNKFLERRDRIWANVSVNLELNNITRNEQNIQKIMAQELTKLQRQRQALGDSTIVLDAAFRESASASPSPAFSKLQDINECASRDLNDCSKHATCTNEFGGFSCQCLPGFEDKYQAQFLADQANGNATSAQLDRNKLGRICMGCSAAYCSNKGECSIVEGKKQCKCRPNFMGARCEIDSEILAIAVGGLLVGLLILMVTFWCLYSFNRRWRREQQKMDAMSATSGLTNYNYVSNSANSTNGLMAPAVAIAQQQQQMQTARSMRRSSTNSNNMGQRFVGSLMGRSGVGGAQMLYHHHLQHQYALEQQAMLSGSGTSSGSSSAASQPLACNPYQGQYAYDEGLLIAPASTSSSEQTSPTTTGYHGIMPAATGNNTNHPAALMAAGNAYTLSGHHHHQQHQLYHQMHHHNNKQTFSQFHPMDHHHRNPNLKYVTMGNRWI